MKKILASTLILFFTLPLFTSAQIKPQENATWINWINPNQIGNPIRKPDGTMGYYIHPANPKQQPLITGPNGTTVIEKAKEKGLVPFLYNSGRIDATGKPIKAVGAYDPNNKNNLQPVQCRLNTDYTDILGIPIEGALHTSGQVWICTYKDASGAIRTAYVPQWHSDDTNKLIYSDLLASKGERMFFDPLTNVFIPPPASTVFHAPILMRQINAGDVLMPGGTPFPRNLLNLEIKGGEPWVSVDILGLGTNESRLPNVAMTPETKPVVGPSGISITLAPESPISGSPTAGAVPDGGGFTGGGSKPVTTRTPSDTFHGIIPFSGGFTIHLNLLTFNWRSGPPEAMLSSDGKALAFFMGFNGVPFITFITDKNKDHKYEAHIVLFEFDKSEKWKPDYLKDWSKIKPVKPPKEFASYEDFVKYVENLPKAK